MTIYCTRAKQQYEAAQAVPPPPHARRVVNPLFKRPPKAKRPCFHLCSMCVARAQRAKSNAGGWQVRRPTGPMGRAPAQRSPPRAARAPSAAAVQEVRWRWRLRRQQQPAGEREPHPSAHPPTSTAGWATRSLPAESAPPFEADARWWS